MNEKELINLLNQITAEVLRRTQSVQPLDVPAPPAQPAQKPCTVVLVPSLVPYQDKALKELITRYGGSLVFVAFSEHFQADRQRVIRADQESRDTILRMLTDAINVVLLAPSLEVIGKIADAQDDDFLTYLFVRAQLWDKKVSVFLDFDLPRFKKSKFQESISDRLKALTDLGVPLVCYRKEAVADPNGNTRTLITERDVIDAYNAGRRQIACRIDSIITPLARDKAGELGVEFTSGEVF